MPLSPQKTLALVAPQRLPGLEKFPEAERSLLAALNAARVDLARAAGRPVATNLKTTDYLAREEEYVRAAPASGGMTLQLPKATRQNQAARITVLLESVAHADLVVQAIGGTVNTASSLTLGAIGRVDFISNGETGWFSERSIAGSASIVESGGEYQLAAGTGDVTWAQNSTVTTISALAVTTGKIAANAVTNAKLAQMAARRIKGREDGAGTGDAQDLTGAEVGEILRLVSTQSDSSTTGTIVTYALNEGTNIVRFLVGVGAAITLRGATIPAEDGQLIIWENNDGTGSTATFNNEDASAAAAGNRFRCPGGANYALTAGHRLITCYINTRHRVIATA